MSYSKKGFLVFILGFLAIVATVTGIFTFQSYFAKADETTLPKEIKIERVTATAAQVIFKTDKEVIASIECSNSQTGPFNLCGAESSATSNHTIKTSIILDPEKNYFVRIKIGRSTYDQLGKPFELPNETTQPSGQNSNTFPDNLLGVCSDSSSYNAKYDVNNDSCIRANDRILFLNK